MAENIPIEKIYVPVKRRKALTSQVVQEIAESILKIGQQNPIEVRRDEEDRYILVDGLHRLEACKALGETTVLSILVSPQAVPAGHRSPVDLVSEAQRQKIERLKKLRLEKEAADKVTAAESRTAMTPPENDREKPGDARRRTSGTPDRAGSESKPVSLSEYLAQREREGFRY